MDHKIWHKTILTWVNSLGLSCFNKIEQLKQSVVEEIIKIVEADPEKSVVNFLSEIFPNYVIEDSPVTVLNENDHLCMCTLILIYVCFSNNNTLEDIRQRMCSKLDNSVQELIRDFLVSIQEKDDVFSLTKKNVMEEIIKFTQRHSLHNSASGDGISTPVKGCSAPMNSDSPLLEFLQTPKRKSEGRSRLQNSSYYHNDQLKKIKELTDQLVEEELKNASLQERLKWHEIKCNEYEVKLKNKIKEIEQLKNDWHDEVANYEKEMEMLNNTLDRKVEEKEKLCKELTYMESYANSIENDLSNTSSEKRILEERLKCSLQKVEEYEEEVKQLMKINSELEDAIKTNEADLFVMKENFMSTCRNESLVDSYLEESFENSVNAPENMGIITEKLLKEKTLENETLSEAVETLKAEKECLSSEIESLKFLLAEKTSMNQQFKELTKQLLFKIEIFVRTCKELQTVQRVFVRFLRDMDEATEVSSNLIKKIEVTDVLEATDLMNLMNTQEFGVTPYSEADSKVLHVIYDSSREITDSASQFSFDENDASHLTTIIESLNESEDGSCRSGSTTTIDIDKSACEQFKMEELNQEIITAKKSLIAFLRASLKNFEVLKIKENLLNEMSKQHEHLENRITSLTELNTRLTKEIINSKNISEIDSEYREKELDNLRMEVESLKKASNLLKEKLVGLEKTNEILVGKKQECMSELALLRERNKSLNNDLQNRIMLQLKQQNSCLGFIRIKQETELDLERTLKIKDEIDKRFVEIRKMLTNKENKISLEIMLGAAEHKFYVTSQNLLHTTYSCLKWSAKSMEHQCLLMGQGDNYQDDEISRSTLKKDQDDNRKRLQTIMKSLKDIVEDLDAIEEKCTFDPYDPLSDSLEVVSASNKTFNIISIDDKQINDEIFSVRKEESKAEQPVPVKENATSWTISPPAKLSAKVPTKIIKKEKPVQGEGWVVPLLPEQKSSTKKSEAFMTKSSYATVATDIEYSPTSQNDVKKTSSMCSFVSASESVPSWDAVLGNDIEDAKESGSDKENPTMALEIIKESDTESVSSSRLRRCLEKKIWMLQKEVLEAMKENERLRIQLRECQEGRRLDRESFDKHQETMKQSITTKYETQLEHLKSEMKALYNRELAKHKTEQSKLNVELKEQNKMYKDHVDELRSQLWDLGEKLLHEQKVKRDLERNLAEIKKRLGLFSYSTEVESRSSQDTDFVCKKERSEEENLQLTYTKQFGSSSFPTIPTEDEDEVFDNRCLEDMKAGICKVEGPEGRLTELQFRNSLCPPHLKSSYPAETQFHNPKLFKENELKYGALNFGQESQSQSLTDSDHSMTRSLLPEEKVKKKEQTSYKKPGPPTPSKNGGRMSLQSGEFHLTPRRVLRESNDANELKSTPCRLRSLFTGKNARRDSLGYKDENAAPAATRGKKLKIFPMVKPFGGRHY